MTDILTEKPNS